MDESSSINTLIGTFSSISALSTRTIDPNNNIICIDTSNNRIGINTIDPSYSIHIVNNNNNTTNGIYTPRLYFDISTLPIGDSNLTPGQVYRDNSGNLKVKL